MPRRKRIYRGCSFLRTYLTESDTWVDKTLSIKKIIEIPQKAVLINGPRRCGKSTMMSILDTFLRIQVDENGNKASSNSNRELFTGGNVELDFDESKSIKPLRIFTEHPEYMRYQGEFSVISMSFQGVGDRNYDKLKSSLNYAISREFHYHYYLLKSSKLTDSQKDKYKKYVNGKFDEVELIDSLRFLSEILSIHHGRKVYILLDEYDRPLSPSITPSLDNLNVVLDSEKIKAMDEAVKLYSSILNACIENNEYLEKLVIVGVWDFSQSLEGAGFRDMRVLKTSDVELSGCFGFSYEDVVQLVNDLELSEEDTIRVIAHIKKFYIGYNTRVSFSETIEVGLPWAITSFLGDFHYEGISSYRQHFWLRSGISNILDRLHSHKLPKNIFDKLKKLTYGGSVELNLTPEFNLIGSLKELQIPDLAPQEREALLESIVAHNLFYSGYITQNLDGHFRVPTAEVQYLFEREVSEYWIYKKLQPSRSDYVNYDSEKLVKSILDKKEFGRELQQLVLNKPGTINDTEEELGALVGAMLDYTGHGYHAIPNSKTHFSKLYNIFYPSASMVKENEDSSAIIHRYTNLYVTDLNEKEKVKERTLNKLLWKAFESKDVNNLLSEHDSLDIARRCNLVKIRALIFIRDEASKKLSVEIKEKDLEIERIRVIQNFLDNELVKELLIGPIENFKKVMRDLKLDPENIDSLLEKHEGFLRYLSESKSAAALGEVPTEIITPEESMRDQKESVAGLDIDGERKRLRDEEEETGSEAGAVAGVVALLDSSEMEPKMCRIQTDLVVQSPVLFCRVEYENPFYNYPHIGEVFKRANEIGGGGDGKEQNNDGRDRGQFPVSFNYSNTNSQLAGVNESLE